MTAHSDAAAALAGLGLPHEDVGLPDSPKRFPDGGQYRIEIPSVEGPEALSTVLAAAAERDVPVHRVSQGSGVMMQTDDEILAMVEQGRAAGVEVCLFTGPRASWDTGIQTTASGGRAIGASLRGATQLRYAVDDVLHAADLGVRSVLVADLGQLWVLGRLKERGHLPADFVLKVSVSLALANPASARVAEDLGAGSLNLPVDLSLAQIAAVRAAVDVPLDIYVEAPDDFGGVVRHHDTPELVRVAAPVYVKTTARNAPNTYPAGEHLRPAVLALARERVRRAELSLQLLRRHYPTALASPIVRAGVLA